MIDAAQTGSTDEDAATGTARRLDDGVYRTRLPGGTEVWSERMDSMRSVAVGFWFRAGSAHEDVASAGIAHLLEHMVFKGTPTRTARELAAEIEDLGGSLDAYTTHEHTSFQARVPDEALATALDVIADLSFRPRLDPVDLALEREVVLEELARVEDTPDDLVFDLHAEFMFAGHPYGRPILGRQETVAAIDASTLQALHAAAYTPRNLVVAAAGRLDHDELVDQVAARLPGDPGRPAPRIERPERFESGLRSVVRPGGRQAHMVAGGAGVSATDPLRHAVTLVGTALGGGMGSRLFQRIREEMGLAYAVYAFRSFYLEGGHVGAYLGTRPETAATAREALFEELGRLAADGLTPEELSATRTQLKGQVVLSLESPGSRMYRLASLGLTGEPYRSLDRVMADVDAIGPAEARAAAELYDPAGLAVLELTPA
ncbi:MAG: pitrilysin family protein [Gemmatimonadales bacterium]|jgi:predicted Zn-dependent peptidase